MDMKQLMTLICTGIAAGVTAQPVLTFQANAPQVGTHYERRFGPYLDPGSAGNAQVWDMSALTTDSLADVDLVSPSTTPFGAQFPTANVAEVSSGSTTYFRVAADGVFMVGYAAEGLAVPFSDEGRFIQFPCAIQGDWSDDYNATFESEGFTIQQDGDITGEADGYGTLVLPGGSVPNVLRVHWVQEETLGTAFFSTQVEFDNYLYYAVGSSYPLLQLTSMTSQILGNTITQQYSMWVGDLTTGVPAPVQNTGHMVLHPVPATDVLHYELPATFSTSVSVCILDASGRTMAALAPGAGQGLKGTVDVGAFAPGMYQLVATDSHGRRNVQRFTVQ